jgi:pimeloyl-ACP methyl ester carboxylesterase
MVFLDTHYAVTPDGVYIAYQIMGDGPIDVVWQSPFPGNIDMEQEGPISRVWFDELASFSRLILHDRRGNGLSSRKSRPPISRRGYRTCCWCWTPSGRSSPS